jgi:alkanesulfonate monooxygenase SsuD/methylene tetrahydromethanopterin reductase-like flavin-dependent oxidoreductase (luciferase family)
MRFGLFYELQLPKPLDSDQWHPDDEYRLVQETLEQIEFADKLGFEYVFEVEHDFLEEYAHSSAPEVVLAAASQRTQNIHVLEEFRVPYHRRLRRGACEINQYQAS